MREIRGDAKNIRSLLGGAKYAIDYWQSEYGWTCKQNTDQVWSFENLLREVRR